MYRKKQWIKINTKERNLNLIDKVLKIRKIKDKDLFLNGTIEDIHDLSLLNDGFKAIEIIKESIKNNEKIVLHHDYDADGSCGGAVAFMMLKELGANVSCYSNNRFVEGYGICKLSVDNILEKYPDTKLIITIDNGIVAFEASDYLKSLGIKLIITDHHEQEKKLPNANAIVNPKRLDSTYPFDGICGAVVVWKILRELYKNKKEANKYLDILAIATVGDVVPLLDENRIIVKEGLKLLRNNTRLSLKIIREMTNSTKITSHFTLAYIYAPIFNAISRLKGKIDLVVDVLISEDEEFIRKNVEQLIEINEKRKALTTTQLKKAKEILSKKEIKEVIVLYDETFDEGIVGLIAGRLKEKYNRPTLVLTKGKSGIVKGSARSVNNFDIKKNLDKCKDLLLSYGGHVLAGGLSLEFNKINDLEERLIKLAKRTLTKNDFIKKFYYIDTLDEKEITEDLIENLNKLEPYGWCFEKPLIRLNDFNINRYYMMGKEKNHVKFIGKNIDLIGWRQSKRYRKKGIPSKITALGYPEINVYKNKKSIQFVIDEDNFF